MDKITPEQMNGLRAFVNQYGLRAVVEALAVIAHDDKEDATSEWLAALALELK